MKLPLPSFPALPHEEREGLQGNLRELPKAPCADQTTAQIAEYYRAAKEGDVAIVRQTHGGFLQYKRELVEGANPQRGRVYVSGFGAFYAKHGKNCFHPKGQTRLVVPTEEVLAWMERNPDPEWKYYTTGPCDE